MPCCSFLISLTILEPRLITPGLGDGPSIAKNFRELENEAEGGKFRTQPFNMSGFIAASQKWMLEQSEMDGHYI